ncbi:putative cytochrome c biosynthesis ccmC-like mitochondrial protein [Bienertia sinuspersici]
MGAFSTLFTLVTRGFRGRPMWGTFWVWDARLTSVFISFLIYLGALCFQKLPVESAPISIRAGPIDIPIIKFSVNWWNTSHQPGSISRSGTSIHVPMLIPILSNLANFLFSTHIFFVLETRRISFNGRNRSYLFIDFAAYEVSHCHPLQCSILDQIGYGGAPDGTQSGGLQERGKECVDDRDLLYSTTQEEIHRSAKKWVMERSIKDEERKDEIQPLLPIKKCLITLFLANPNFMKCLSTML